jgi:hypothetical protein
MGVAASLSSKKDIAAHAMKNQSSLKNDLLAEMELQWGGPSGQDIEGFTTIYRSPIRKKKKVQHSGKRTSPDKIREKVNFGKASGLQGIKKEHTKVYMQAFGYTIADFIPCEITGHRCNDVHHIYARGIGGSELEDELYNRIENLMGLTREKHTELGDKEQHYDYLIQKHFEFLSNNGVAYDKNFFDKWPK